MATKKNLVKNILESVTGIKERTPESGQKVWMVCVKEMIYHSSDEDNTGSYWQELPDGERIIIGWSDYKDCD